MQIATTNNPRLKESILQRYTEIKKKDIKSNVYEFQISVLLPFVFFVLSEYQSHAASARFRNWNKQDRTYVY